MLSFNNTNDINKMMKYHRTRDMINLLLYFPEISSISDLVIINDYDDYLKNYDILKNHNGERNDTLITKPFMPSMETKGHDFDVEELFKKIKKIDKDSVLVLFNSREKPRKRYETDAALNIDIIVGSGIYIDIVGMGYDGREVSKGLDCHERYFIPWHSLRNININNYKEYRQYIITKEKYIKSRKNRINFLCSIGYSKDLAETAIPKEYNEMSVEIWYKIINKILKKLEKRQQEFINDNLNEFVINLNIEDNEIHAWQMYTNSRYKK